MKPLLSDTLSVLLPSEQETLLLRACLQPDDGGREAWYAWQECVGERSGELLQRYPSIVHLLPLLHAATTRYGARVPRDLAFCLRAAYFREELRGRAYRDVLHKVLLALEGEGIEFVVLKGAALAGTVYDDWALRHCHDIDLLVDEGDHESACRVLQTARLGQRCASSPASRDVRLVHDSGLPIELHADLFEHPFYRQGEASVRRRRLTTSIAGVPAPVLSPSAALLHVCGHASYSRSRSDLRWATDAWSILAKCSDLDWDALLGDAARARLALPLYVMHEYLSDELHAAIPRSVLETLSRDARHVGLVAHEAALFGARREHRQLRSVTRDWRSRAFLLRWRLLPSPSYLRWTYAVRPRSRIPFLYLERAVRYVARRARKTRRFSLGAPRVSPVTERPWMPTERQVLLVKAALLARGPAIDAWNQWKRAGNSEGVDDGSAALLPIVYQRLVDHGVNDPLVKRARDAYKATWLENERRFREVAELLGSLDSLGIETMVLKGVALALLYYQDPGLRPMGDVDILVRPRDVADTIDALTRLAWRQIGRTPRLLSETYLNARREIHFVNSRGMYLDLHWRVMDEACLSSTDEWFWSGAIRMSVRGVETHAMNPTDQLLHVCVHATLWTPSPLPRWIVDAATILRTSCADIDWDRLVSHAQRLGLVIPLRETLRQLVEVFDSSIPLPAVDTLRSISASKEEMRAYKIRCLPRSPLETLSLEFRRMSLQSPGRGRARRLLAFPAYARALWGLDHAWQLPVCAVKWGVRTARRLPGYYWKRLIGRNARHS
jgi:hypothetical protein